MSNAYEMGCMDVVGRKPLTRALEDYYVQEAIHGRPTGLIGLWLRNEYTRYPSKKAGNDDLTWLKQAMYKKAPKHREAMGSIFRIGEYVYACAGCRAHRVRDASLCPEESHDSLLKACELVFRGLPYTQLDTITLNDFTQVDYTTVKYRNAGYNEEYILQAFAGSDRMEVHYTGKLDVLILRNGAREAAIMPMRI